MTIQTLKQGIELIRENKHREGAQLIRIALKSPEVDAKTQAIGWLWLAEAAETPKEKITCYNTALQLDPDNQQAHDRRAYLLAQDLPPAQPKQEAPTPPQSMPPGNTPPAGMPAQQNTPPTGMPAQNTPPQQTARPVDYNNYTAQSAQQPMPTQPVPSQPTPTQQQVPPGQPQQPPVPGTQPMQANNTLVRTVGIFDGPNGPGTGFFINQSGFVVTTRWVVGGTETVTYELNRGQRGQARVVRAWPQYDVALIYTGVQINQTLPMTTTPTIPDNMPLNAISHNGQVANGIRRGTRTVIKEGWFPTTIEAVPDAGGNPIFNQQNLLVGMLTRNAHPSAPYVFGLHITLLLRLMDQYTQAVQSQQQLSYCPSCGNLCQAAAYGGFYCEHCGSVLPHAEGTQRFPMPKMASLYGENMTKPCPNCASTVGFYKGSCLRCGYEV